MNTLEDIKKCKWMSKYTDETNKNTIRLHCHTHGFTVEYVEWLEKQLDSQPNIKELKAKIRYFATILNSYSHGIDAENDIELIKEVEQGLRKLSK